MIKLTLYVLAALVGTQASETSTKLTIKKVVVEDAHCYNYANGSAQVQVQGGVAPYQYSLDGKHFQTEPLFKHLKAGDYRVYLKDAKGNLNTTTFKVNQPEKIRFAPTKVTFAGCCEPNGAVLVEAHGGTGTLQYQINESAFQKSGYFSGLAGGYTVVAMDSLGCKATVVVRVDDFSGPMIDFLNSTEVSCPGGNNGSLDVFAVGGSGTILYSIDRGKNWQKESTFKNLEAGQYMVKIKDAMGCTDSAEIIISQPPVIETRAQLTSKNDKKNFMVEVLYSIGGTGQHEFSLDGQVYSSQQVLYSNSEKPLIYTRDMAGCIAITSFEQYNVLLKKK